MGKGSSKGKTGGCWPAGSVPARVVLRVQNWPEVDSWNQANYDLTNQRLKADWDHICNQTYTGGWAPVGPACRVTAALALDALELGTSLAYRSDAKDIGYVQGAQ